MNNEVKLEIRDMTKKYKNGDGVENINLKVKTGELVTLLGPSGCGKTTILRTIGGFLECTAGSILIDDKHIEDLPPEKRPTAMVFQSYNLWPHMTVFENMEFGLKLRKIPKAERHRLINDMASLVKISGMEKKYPGQMSGGQQQRVAIARSLLLKPDVLLMDEPFSALDAKIRSQMREELRKIQLDLNITVVFVTHDQEEAMALSDRIVVMNKGCFEQIGTPSEIYEKPATRYVAEFIGDMNFIELKDKTLAVRPENINISQDGLEGIEGSVRAVMILGHYTEITLDTEHGILKVFLTGEALQSLHPGKKAKLAFSKAIEFPKSK
ncbi:ABC transporter ATP-binding protein [Treponema sp.]